MDKPMTSEEMSASAGEPVQAAQSKSFVMKHDQIPLVVQSLKDWCLGDGFEVQTRDLVEGGMCLQARKSALWRKVLGMSTSLTVFFHPVGEDSVNVEIGEYAWLDEAITGGVALLIFQPLLITAGIGLYFQAGLPEKVYDHVTQFLETK